MALEETWDRREYGERRILRDRPKALDLYCAGGGASRGLADAGFTVTGVDLNPDCWRWYPYDFYQGDALNLDPDWVTSFDFIWASPPCQAWSIATLVNGNEHPKLIEATRQALDRSGRPWIMENVTTAPLRPDLTLCGYMFGQRLIRHRWFEFGGGCPIPIQPVHVDHDLESFAVYGNSGGRSRSGKHNGYHADWAAAMGIDWLPGRLLKEAVPPAYSSYCVGPLVSQLKRFDISAG